MKRTALSLLIWTTAIAGCSSTSKLMTWSGREAKQPAAVQERSDKSVAQNDLNTTASALRSVEAGQSEIALYRQDFQDHHLQLARKNFEAALVDSPNNSHAHNGLAIVADIQRDWGKAEHHYKRALAQDPADSLILGNMGYSFLLQDRLVESELYLKMSVESDPSNTKSLQNLAEVYTQLGKNDLASQTLAKLSAQEISQRQAETTAATTETQLSLMDRLRKKKTPGEKFAEDFERRKAESQLAAQDQSQRGGKMPMTAQQRLQHDENIRRQFQIIDQEAYAQAGSNSPIMLNNLNGQMTRMDAAQIQQHMAHSANAPMTAEAPVQHTVAQPETASPAEELPKIASAKADAAAVPPATAQPQPAEAQTETVAVAQAADQPATQNSASPAVAQSEQAVASAAGQEQVVAQAAPVATAAAVQTASAETPANSSAEAASQTVVAAVAEVASGENQSVQVANASAPAAQDASKISEPSKGWRGNSAGTGVSAPQPSDQRSMAANQYQLIQAQMLQQQMPFGPGFAPNSMNSSNGLPAANAHGAAYGGDPAAVGSIHAFNDATRMAARIGMGLGPSGQTMPAQYSGSTQGAQSPELTHPSARFAYENAGVPAPNRAMPDDRIVKDLNNTYQPYGSSLTPPATTHGGPAMQSVMPMQSRQQYDNTMRFDTQSMQNTNIPASHWSAMQGYEAERWAAGQQQNRQIQQMWAQGPVNSAVSQTAGSQYSLPTNSGPMYTPNPPAGMSNWPGSNGPPAWPYAPQQPASPPANYPGHGQQQFQQPSRNQPNAQYGYQPQQFGQNVVIPPNYGTNIDQMGMPEIRPRQ